MTTFQKNTNCFGNNPIQYIMMNYDISIQIIGFLSFKTKHLLTNKTQYSVYSDWHKGRSYSNNGQKISNIFKNYMKKCVTCEYCNQILGNCKGNPIMRESYYKELTCFNCSKTYSSCSTMYYKNKNFYHDECRKDKLAFVNNSFLEEKELDNIWIGSIPNNKQIEHAQLTYKEPKSFIIDLCFECNKKKYEFIHIGKEKLIDKYDGSSRFYRSRMEK